MNTFFSRLMAVALLGLVLAVTFHASVNAKDGPACLPREAGGTGTQLTTVDHPDSQVVIHTYLCNGQPTWVYGLYKWGPLRNRPQKAGTYAYELRKLYTQMGHMAEDKAAYDALARRQLEDYQLSPYELKKQSRNNRSVA